MGAITFLFLTFVAYLALKGRLGTYIALATTQANPATPQAAPGAAPAVPQPPTGNSTSGIPAISLMPSLPALQDFHLFDFIPGFGDLSSVANSLALPFSLSTSKVGSTYNPGKGILGLPQGSSTPPGYNVMKATPK